VAQTEKFLEGSNSIFFGASRGIGREMAMRAAALGARVGIVGTTDAVNPKKAGTIHSVAAEINAAGGQAIAIKCDTRDSTQIAAALKTMADFGGDGHVDHLIYVASSLLVKPIELMTEKDWDLIHQVNARGAWFACQHTIPYLKASAALKRKPHIVTISPPVDLEWLGDLPDVPNGAYTISKFNMTMTALAFAAMLKDVGVASNSLWPKTVIDTEALKKLVPLFPDIVARSRSPKIMADALAVLLHQEPWFTGKSLIDETLLRGTGITDFSGYATVAGTPDGLLYPDWFLPRSGKN
jgi:citronellol/citronellal dehydrogenase